MCRSYFIHLQFAALHRIGRWAMSRWRRWQATTSCESWSLSGHVFCWAARLSSCFRFWKCLTNHHVIPIPPTSLSYYHILSSSKCNAMFNSITRITITGPMVWHLLCLRTTSCCFEMLDRSEHHAPLMYHVCIHVSWCFLFRETGAMNQSFSIVTSISCKGCHCIPSIAACFG